MARKKQNCTKIGNSWYCGRHKKKAQLNYERNLDELRFKRSKLKVGALYVTRSFGKDELVLKLIDLEADGDNHGVLGSPVVKVEVVEVKYKPTRDVGEVFFINSANLYLCDQYQELSCG